MDPSWLDPNSLSIQLSFYPRRRSSSSMRMYILLMLLICEISFMPQIGGSASVTGFPPSPTLSSGDKTLNFETTNNSNIYLSPNQNGIVFIDSAVGESAIMVDPSNIAADIILESGTVNGISGTGSGNVVLCAGGMHRHCYEL